MIITRGPPVLTILADMGKESWSFEMHVACGPMPVSKHGASVAVPETSEFWQIVSWWAQQGERLYPKTKVCRWERPKLATRAELLGEAANRFEYFFKKADGSYGMPKCHPQIRQVLVCLKNALEAKE